MLGFVNMYKMTHTRDFTLTLKTLTFSYICIDLYTRPLMFDT